MNKQLSNYKLGSSQQVTSEGGGGGKGENNKPEIKAPKLPAAKFGFVLHRIEVDIKVPAQSWITIHSRDGDTWTRFCQVYSPHKCPAHNVLSQRKEKITPAKKSL